jgi:hypothetical protein
MGLVTAADYKFGLLGIFGCCRGRRIANYEGNVRIKDYVERIVTTDVRGNVSSTYHWHFIRCIQFLN